MAAKEALVHPDIKPDADGNPVVIEVPPSTAKVLKTRGWKGHKPSKTTTKKSGS